MIYKYIFSKAYKGYLALEGKSGLPIFSALLIVSVLQSSFILGTVLVGSRISNKSLGLSKIEIIIPAALVVLLNYIWLCKINQVNDVLQEIDNLPKSKSNILGVLVAAHVIICISLFVIAASLKINR